MRSSLRSFIAATAVAAAAVTGGVVTAAPASAAPPPKPIPRFAPDGEAIAVIGNHDFCRGTVFMNFTSPKPAVTRVTATSGGFTGNGPSWTKNPKCGFQIGLGYYSAIAFGKSATVNASFGPRPGEKVSRDIVTGSGLVSMSVVTSGLPVVTSYLIVP